MVLLIEGREGVMNRVRAAEMREGAGVHHGNPGPEFPIQLRLSPSIIIDEFYCGLDKFPSDFALNCATGQLALKG